LSSKRRGGSLTLAPTRAGKNASRSSKEVAFLQKSSPPNHQGGKTVTSPKKEVQRSPPLFKISLSTSMGNRVPSAGRKIRQGKSERKKKGPLQSIRKKEKDCRSSREKRGDQRLIEEKTRVDLREVQAASRRNGWIKPFHAKRSISNL